MFGLTVAQLRSPLPPLFFAPWRSLSLLRWLSLQPYDLSEHLRWKFLHLSSVALGRGLLSPGKVDAHVVWFELHPSSQQVEGFCCFALQKPDSSGPQSRVTHNNSSLHTAVSKVSSPKEASRSLELWSPREHDDHKTWVQADTSFLIPNHTFYSRRATRASHEDKYCRSQRGAAVPTPNIRTKSSLQQTRERHTLTTPHGSGRLFTHLLYNQRARLRTPSPEPQRGEDQREETRREGKN